MQLLYYKKSTSNPIKYCNKLGMINTSFLENGLTENYDGSNKHPRQRTPNNEQSNAMDATKRSNANPVPMSTASRITTADRTQFWETWAMHVLTIVDRSLKLGNNNNNNEKLLSP